MKFLCYCDNKGCLKEMEPVLDKDTMIAYCTECDKEIKNLSVFMKRQMLFSGQIKKDIAKKIAWSVKCPHCNKENLPSLEDNSLICSLCKKKIDHLAKPFENMIKKHIKSKKED